MVKFQINDRERIKLLPYVKSLIENTAEVDQLQLFMVMNLDPINLLNSVVNLLTTTCLKG